MSLFGNGRARAGSELAATEPVITRISSRRPGGDMALQISGRSAQLERQPGPKVSTLDMRAFYVATTEDRLAEFLSKHPEIATPALAAALEKDLALSTEYGDTDAALLAAEGAASIHALLGNTGESLARYLDLLRLQENRADTLDELHDLRTSALVIGSIAITAARASAMAECWLVAVRADLRLTDLTARAGRAVEESTGHLLDAMRLVADLGELLADLPAERRRPAQLRGFVQLLGDLSERGTWAEWSPADVMGVQALLRRYRRVCRRLVKTGTGPRNHPDALVVDWVESALRRLSVQPRN